MVAARARRLPPSPRCTPWEARLSPASPLLRLRRVVPTDIAAEVIRMLAVELNVPETRLAPQHLLVEDLGLDSLAAVRLLAAVESHFGVELIGTDYLEVRCVGDLVRFVEQHLTGEGARS